MKNFFIGMIFIFLNFNLTFNGHIIGLLPGFVGYYFVLEGIKSFNGEIPAFEKIKQLCTIMIAVYAVVYALDLLAVNLGFLGIVIGFAMLAANLYMSFHLTEGFIYIEKTKLIDLGAADLREKWKLVCIMMCASTVLIYVPLVNIIAIIANAVCSILFLVQFNKTKNLGIWHGM
ncbi:MAG: hypothetical protein J6B21_09165 [Oscillospiraceae bacterium]|nr:hypothetical protein [Oscillospiraceae bacterium]